MLHMSLSPRNREKTKAGDGLLLVDDRLPSVRVALVGGFAPRQCGIATFSTDVYESIMAASPDVAIDVYPMVSATDNISFGPPVQVAIREGDRSSFVDAAELIERSCADVVWLQHEFGLFGGSAGDQVFDLLDKVSAPLVVTLHTVLADPDDDQRRVMLRLIARAKKLVVMSEHGRQLLRDVYHVGDDQIALLPHGVPDRPFGRSAMFKRKFGLEGRNVLMTFGLLSPGKGIETVIAALPAIVARHPETTYCIVGATHPNLRAQQGERYRTSLQDLADECGVSANIRWIDRFVETDELLDMIEMADIYVTPYLGAAQATSGTLSYAFALGKAVVSTPYVHASELLAENHGILVPFGNAPALGTAISDLLDDPESLTSLQKRAYARGRAMIWPAFAAQSLAIIDEIRNPPQPRRSDARRLSVARVPSFDGIVRLSDATGMFQHSRLSVPDRNHGYCIDDNARALMLMNRTDHPDADRWAHVYAAFVQHAWNPDTRRFRNFMGFGRNWLEDTGSEDSNGRTLWALGATASEAPNARLRRWALGLFEEAGAITEQFESPRALAFAALGADHVLSIDPAHALALAIADHAVSRLSRLLADVQRPDWCWFETRLAYDNCRLPETLIRIGMRSGRNDLVVKGVETLEWIMERQMTPAGRFRPIGSEGFGEDGVSLPFDQQPVEIWAAIDASAAAYDATRDERWLDCAVKAHGWFFGANDRNIAVADLDLGTCCDGINPRGINLNEGAESTLALHLGDNMFQTLMSNSRGTTIMTTPTVELVA